MFGAGYSICAFVRVQDPTTLLGADMEYKKEGIFYTSRQLKTVEDS